MLAGAAFKSVDDGSSHALSEAPLYARLIVDHRSRRVLETPTIMLRATIVRAANVTPTCIDCAVIVGSATSATSLLGAGT